MQQTKVLPGHCNRDLLLILIMFTRNRVDSREKHCIKSIFAIELSFYFCTGTNGGNINVM